VIQRNLPAPAWLELKRLHHNHISTTGRSPGERRRVLDAFEPRDATEEGDYVGSIFAPRVGVNGWEATLRGSQTDAYLVGAYRVARGWSC
jgi:hypothetical protein